MSAPINVQTIISQGARGVLSPVAEKFLSRAISSIDQLLPHVEIEKYQVTGIPSAGAKWISSDRKEISLKIRISQERFLDLTIVRRRLDRSFENVDLTLDTREHAICRTIAQVASEALSEQGLAKHPDFLSVYGEVFDERVVTKHLKEHHHLVLDVGNVFNALHKLSEQSYENEALSFGCLLNPHYMHGRGTSGPFPDDYLKMKKYRALSDGHKTAYMVSSDGHVMNYVDLEGYRRSSFSHSHYYPQWAEGMAKASRKGICGIALTRSGDILVFDNATLRFTYRKGHWQYWNHSYLVGLFSGLARARHVPPKEVGDLVFYLYRCALDVSFRHSGALFVVLRNAEDAEGLLQRTDLVRSPVRSPIDREFDDALPAPLPVSIAAELASIDGALVVNNNRKVRAFGAILKQYKIKQKYGVEGSRTKAAISASRFGLAIKVSADGDISIFSEGEEFMKIGG